MNAKTLVSFLIWLALFGLTTYMVDGMMNPNKASRLGSGQTVVLQRDHSGYYRAEAFINGTKADVLIDTGATEVAISKKLANRLGLKSTAAIRTSTANGDTVSYMIRLNSVKLGGIEATDVSATIAPNLGEDALLGMSFLGRMDIRLYQGTMTIRQVRD